MEGLGGVVLTSEQELLGQTEKIFLTQGARGHEKLHREQSRCKVLALNVSGHVKWTYTQFVPKRGGDLDASPGDISKKALALQGARYPYHPEISHEQTW